MAARGTKLTIWVVPGRYRSSIRWRGTGRVGPVDLAGYAGALTAQPLPSLASNDDYVKSILTAVNAAIPAD